MRKFLFLLAFLFFQQLNCIVAQSTEVGAFLGLSNYLGDLQPDNSQSNTAHYSFGVFGRYNYNELLSFKAHLYKGDISGSDENSLEGSGRRVRNLSFRSKIIEFGIQGEYNFTGHLAKYGDPIGALYLFGGIAGFYFNPQAPHERDWVDLQPLGTEGQFIGQGSPYSRFQVSIPAGIGGKINLGEFSVFGFEVGLRKTFTDYLDDVSTNYADMQALEAFNPVSAAVAYRTDEYLVNSRLDDPSTKQRGGSDYKDWYTFIGITFSLNITEIIANGY